MYYRVLLKTGRLTIKYRKFTMLWISCCHSEILTSVFWTKACVQQPGTVGILRSRNMFSESSVTLPRWPTKIQRTLGTRLRVQYQVWHRFLLRLHASKFEISHLLTWMGGRTDAPISIKHCSNWEPPVQPSNALETYLEEVKLQLPDINAITKGWSRQEPVYPRGNSLPSNI